jgi:hypothetical protein
VRAPPSDGARGYPGLCGRRQARDSATGIFHKEPGLNIVSNNDLNGKVVKRMVFVEDENKLVTSVIIYFTDRAAFVVTGKELGFTPNEDITQLLNRRPTGMLPPLPDDSQPS